MCDNVDIAISAMECRGNIALSDTYVDIRDVYMWCTHRYLGNIWPHNLQWLYEL